MSVFKLTALGPLSPGAKTRYLAQVNAILRALPDDESWNSRRTGLYQYATHVGEDRAFWLKFLNSFLKLHGAAADLSDVIARIDEARPVAPTPVKKSSAPSSPAFK